MKREQQLIHAANLGALAHKAGKRCLPIADSNLLQMLKGRQYDVTPEGEAGTVEILKAWTDNWHLEKERYFNEVNLLITNAIHGTVPITNLNKIYK